MLPKATKSMTVCFPDVCKTPTPPGPEEPIPYPNIAKTAQKVQTKAIGKKGGEVLTRLGATIATPEDGVSSDTAREIQQLKAMLNELNAKLQRLRSDDPNQWQAVLQEFAVAASALYVTMQFSGGDRP